MPTARPIQPSFAAGEISPRLFGRVDLTKYAIGLETCENFIVMPHGGVRKRGGTRFIAEVKASANLPRLVPFTFSTEQAYVLEFGDQYIRFYRDQAQIISGGPYEIGSPYLQADLDKLRFAQSADTLFIVHPGYAPRKLTRTGHTAWTLSLADAVNGPFRALNADAALKIKASANTGSVTLTATSAVFVAGHVGALLRLFDASNSRPYPTLNTNSLLAVNDIVEFGLNVYKVTAETLAAEELWGVETKVTHTRGTVRFFKDTSTNKSVDFAFQHSGFGIVKVTAVASGTSATATVQGDALLPDSVLAGSGTEYWQEGAWSTLRGFPSALTFFEQRLWFAATPADPQTVWGSKTNAYLDFADGAKDADALGYAIASAQVDAISWLVPAKVMAIGTDSAEYIMSASSLNEAVTPTNIRVASDTRYGSSAAVPVQVSNAVLFTQRRGVRGNAAHRLRELVYSFETDGYVAPDLTLVSEHISRPGLVELAYQAAPDSIIWAVRADGQLVGMTYEREQQVVAWHRHVIGGVSDALGTPAKVERIAAIPGAAGDELWLVVQRRINGATRRFVEVLVYGLEDDAAQADATFLDSFLTYSGAPATTLSGLGHLEGETVGILGDGAAYASKVVASGAVGVDPAVSKACVGLPYAATLKTLRIEAGAAGGTAQGRKKRIATMVLRLHRSLGGKAGPDLAHLDVLPTRSTLDPMGSPPPLYSGDVGVDFDGGWDTEGQIVVRHDLPLPMIVLAIMPEVRTTG